MRYIYSQIARLFETGLMAVGTHLATAVGGIFFFGFPVSFAVSAYAMAILSKQGISMPFAVAAAIAASLLSGAFFGFLYRRLSSDSFAVISLASVFAFDAVVRSWDSLTGGVLGIAGVSRPEFASTLPRLVLLGATLMGIAMLLEFLVLNSRFGRSLRGLKENSSVLASFGISPMRTGSAIILLSSLLSGLAGMLTIWRIQFLDPGFGGVLLLIQGLTIAILANKPRVRWLAGSLAFVVLLPELLRFFEFPTTMLGHMRMLTYSLMLVGLVYWVSYNQPEKRIV